MDDFLYARADAPDCADEPNDAPVFSLKEAIETAQPGTTIKLLPGRFTTKIRMRQKHGRDDAPIIIQGTLGETPFDGLVNPLKMQKKRKAKWWTETLAGRDLRALRNAQCPIFCMEKGRKIIVPY